MLSFFLSLFLCFTQFCGSFHCLFGKFFDIISKTSQQLSKVTQWFAQIFESVKISPRWHMLPFDCTANAFEPFGRCLPLLHRQILPTRARRRQAPNLITWQPLHDLSKVLTETTDLAETKHTAKKKNVFNHGHNK